MPEFFFTVFMQKKRYFSPKGVAIFEKIIYNLAKDGDQNEI